MKSSMKPKNSQQNASKRGNYHQQPRPLLEMPETAETETKGMRRRQRRISTSGGASKNRSAMPKRGGRKEAAGAMEAENEAIEFRRRFASAESRRPNLSIPTDFDEEEAAEQLRRLPSLLARLETAMHFWEVGRPSGRKESVGIFDEADGTGFERMRPLDGRIPDNYGLLLNSDLPSMNDQLAGIRQNLIQLRQFGFSQPTVEYFQNYRLRPLSNEFHRPKTYSGIFRANLRESSPPTLAQIRAHLLNMEFHVEKRIRELMTERRKLGNDGGENVKDSHNPMERMEWQLPQAPIGKRQTTVQFEENLQQKRSIHQSSFPTYSSHIRHDSTSNPSQSHPNVWAKQMNEEEPFQQESLGGANKSHPMGASLPTAAPFVDDKPHVRPLVFGKSSQEIEMEKHMGLENVDELKLVEENAKNDEQSKAEKVENTIVPSANEGGGIGQNQGEESANFQRMLQVLKNPRRFDLSSSSSSSDEEADRGPTKLPMNELAPTNLQKNPSPSSSSQPPASTMSASFGATFPTGIQQKKGNESDSDSDFFK